MTHGNPSHRLAVPDAIDPAALRGFDPGAPVVQIGGSTMGTTWQVRAALPVALDLSEQALHKRIQARLDGIEHDMSHWNAESSLSRFNHAPAGSQCALTPDFASVMKTALDIAWDTDGAFDPAIGRLTDLWGLGPRAADSPPSEAEIERCSAASGWPRLFFDPLTAIIRQPGGLWLDLSGIAKGFAVDAVADLLGEQGVYHALVEIGGECVGRGMRPDGDPWWVDLECPPGIILPGLRIALHQLAVATSGDYLRGAHTLDPRTGRPAVHATTAVSVVHPHCMHADAWATALSVIPLATAQHWAESYALATRIVLRDGSEWLSPALAAMMTGEDAAVA